MTYVLIELMSVRVFVRGRNMTLVTGLTGRLVGASASVVLAATALVGGAVATAAPAQAASRHCDDYLRSLGYNTPFMGLHCMRGESTVGEAWQDCLNGLAREGIQPAHAQRACQLARWGF
ncbi:hypothetical protein [Streptomyces albipurpureus]|uniref:Secreted protein n=1 Tax=Streptomyces albipurpureus TaxID=2897419 RepID=A0ABT0UIV0_9ACTN|nr:hypothetical protein [Streptomyces sp. CWNU-1]MCM2387535.1 hypothetical protein [Streptomyces sp. CWNU-1]